jgi:hypothetical protein
LPSSSYNGTTAAKTTFLLTARTTAQLRRSNPLTLVKDLDGGQGRAHVYEVQTGAQKVGRGEFGRHAAVSGNLCRLENYTFLTRPLSSQKPNVFGVLHDSILEGFSNA